MLSSLGQSCYILAYNMEIINIFNDFISFSINNLINFDFIMIFIILRMYQKWNLDWTESKN